MKALKTTIKTVKSEIHEIKWLKSKDVLHQTLFTFGIVTAAAAIFMIYETGIQMLLSLVIK